MLLCVINIVIKLYAKFDYDRLRNEKVLVLWKSDKNKNSYNNNEQEQLS